MTEVIMTNSTIDKGEQMWTLMDWDIELLKTCSSKRLLDTVTSLPEIARSSNAICDLISPTGHVVSIGIALAHSEDNPELESPLACINHQFPSGDPPYHTIVGDETLDAASGEIVVFRCEGGEWTEIPKRNCVSTEQMVKVVRAFIETESLTGSFTWEEV